jgi:hypothetical protein
MYQLANCYPHARRYQQIYRRYEQDVDEIVAACCGDLRGAVKALMLINKQLEQTLQRLSAIPIEKQWRISRSKCCIEPRNPSKFGTYSFIVRAATTTSKQK